MSYQYGLAGSRARMTWPDGFYIGYTYNNADDLTGIGENRVRWLDGSLASVDGGVSRTFSTAGVWDDVTIATLGFGYSPASQITQTTRFLYDGQDLIGEADNPDLQPDEIAARWMIDSNRNSAIFV